MAIEKVREYFKQYGIEDRIRNLMFPAQRLNLRHKLSEWKAQEYAKRFRSKITKTAAF